MAKTLLTGATGFVGSHVARLLVERGDDLRVTVRARSNTVLIDDLDCERVRCDILDRRAVRRAFKGVDRVFHLAGLTSIRPRDATRLFEVNVDGVRNVLGEALRVGVERAVYGSSAAALGPARRGRTADETNLFRAAHLDIPYVNSVHEAEVEAFRIAAKGLPLVCTNPTAAFGPGDIHSTSTRIVHDFLLGRLPLYPDGAINVVDVRDAGFGMLLADELGNGGERYILGGRNFTFDRLFSDLGRLSGVHPPVRVPKVVAAGAAAVLAAGLGNPPLRASEVAAAGEFWTYSSAKASRELGWHPRPHEETLEATVAWYLDREGDRIVRARRSQELQYRAAGAAIGAAEGVAGTAAKIWRRLPGSGG